MAIADGKTGSLSTLGLLSRKVIALAGMLPAVFAMGAVVLLLASIGDLDSILPSALKGHDSVKIEWPVADQPFFFKDKFKSPDVWYYSVAENRHVGDISSYGPSIFDELKINPTQLDPRAAFERIAEKATIVFNHPPTLTMGGEPGELQLLMGIGATPEKLIGLIDVPGEVATPVEIKATQQMEAELKGAMFRITPLQDSKSPLWVGSNREWRWQITPKQEGNHTLFLIIKAHFKLEGETFTRQIETFRRTITVKARPGGFCDSDICRDSISAIIGALAVSLLAAIGFLINRRYFRDEQAAKPEPAPEQAPVVVNAEPVTQKPKEPRKDAESKDAKPADVVNAATDPNGSAAK
jgi:hypothetical protein